MQRVVVVSEQQNPEGLLSVEKGREKRKGKSNWPLFSPFASFFYAALSTLRFCQNHRHGAGDLWCRLLNAGNALSATIITASKVG